MTITVAHQLPKPDLKLRPCPEEQRAGHSYPTVGNFSLPEHLKPVVFFLFAGSGEPGVPDVGRDTTRVCQLSSQNATRPKAHRGHLGRKYLATNHRERMPESGR
jgi:hypothetical protein